MSRTRVNTIVSHNRYEDVFGHIINGRLTELKMCRNLNILDRYDNNPLHIAIMKNDMKISEYLLKNGINMKLLIIYD